jgi:hypothetical protein
VPPAAAEAANFTSDSAYTLNGHALRMDEKQRSLWITTPRAQETPRAQGASPSTEEEEVFVPSQDPSPVAASPIEMAAISTVSTVAASLVEMVHKGGEKRGAEVRGWGGEGDDEDQSEALLINCHRSEALLANRQGPDRYESEALLINRALHGGADGTSSRRDVWVAHE